MYRIEGKTYWNTEFNSNKYNVWILEHCLEVIFLMLLSLCYSYCISKQFMDYDDNDELFLWYG